MYGFPPGLVLGSHRHANYVDGCGWELPITLSALSCESLSLFFFPTFVILKLNTGEHVLYGLCWNASSHANKAFIKGPSC